MGVMSEMIQAVQQAHPRELPLNVIVCQRQARRYFDPKHLEQLSRSIAEIGVLQPLLVTENPEQPGFYRLIAGERRYRAAQMAGLTTVPVHVLPNLLWTPAKLQAVTLLENLQRHNLNPYEETLATLELLALEFNKPQNQVESWLQRLDNAKRGRTQNVLGTEIAQVQAFFERLGLIRWQSFVRCRLPLLHLPDDVRHALERGTIPYSVALKLKQINDPDERLHWLTQAEQGISVRELNRYLKAINQPQQGEAWHSLKRHFRTLDWHSLEPTLQGKLEQKAQEILRLLSRPKKNNQKTLKN